jgi:hypothetical protein
LALPHGSQLQKLENTQALKTYAATHAESWFEYVIRQRGRQLNGPLYLITGWEKATSWGIASFHSANRAFELSFKPTTEANHYRWSGNLGQDKYYDPLMADKTPGNQTMFIHGFSISLRTGILAGLLSTVQIRENDYTESELGSTGGHSMSSVQGLSLSSWAHSLFGGGAATGGNYTRQRGDVILQDLPPISKA